MSQSFRIALIALIALAAGAAAACTQAPATSDDGRSAEQTEPLTVTAADLAKLPAGAAYTLDVARHSYRFDSADGALDYSRVLLDAGQAEPLPMSDVLATAAENAGVSVESFVRKPFVVEQEHEARADRADLTDPSIAPKRWCSVEVWIAPEGPDDIFRIGHVWVNKKHC